MFRKSNTWHQYWGGGAGRQGRFVFVFLALEKTFRTRQFSIGFSFWTKAAIYVYTKRMNDISNLISLN